MKWIARLPTGMLAVFAVVMAFAPFTPEPHLVEKFRMLLAGTLTRPIDLLDVFWHMLPTLLLLLNIAARRTRS